MRCDGISDRAKDLLLDLLRLWAVAAVLVAVVRRVYRV
jgi:hypothetical protein